MINHSRTFVTLLLAFLFARHVDSLGDTDTITWGGDNGRSGYQTNHNMDPSVVAGASFGQLWRAALPGNFNGIGPEQIFSQPLVYTGDDGIQYVYIATTQNNLYKINAKTGAIVKSRNMHVPFLTADLDGCVDINPSVGVTATGVIDPSTGIWYLTSKTYSDQFQDGAFTVKSPPGRLNGRYYFHAINTADLSEASGFPKMIDGLQFRNNPNRMFQGGNTHARPGMLQVGDYIYTGWASHCVQYNFTGALIGFHRTTGAVVEAFAMEGGPEANTVKGAGVWMSGGGLSYDKGSIFIASGNGYASQLKSTGDALPGRQPPTALEEAAVNFVVGGDGSLTPVDFFMPWEKTQLDGADKDLGTTPLEILPSNVFSCANVKRMGVVTGKSGKTYWLNLDNLGGYQMGPNRLDAAVQVYQNENSVYAGAGVMPLGGGYVYINVIQYQTHVFKFSCSAGGDPQFTLVSNTPEKNAYILGVGHGTTTSLNGQEGTGLLWTTDVEGYNLRIYDAIPPADGGNLKLLRAFNIPGVTKFSRPVFGNGIAYVGTTQGYLYAFGSPVNLPLNCSSPYEFPNTAIGNVSAPLSITCKALIDLTVTGVGLTGNPNFKVGAVNTPLALTAGQTFSVSATFAPNTVGLLSSDILVNTTNNVAKYSGSTPITLKGTSNSAKPLLAIAPNTVSFNIVAGQQADGVTQSSLISNRGDKLLTVQSIQYSTTSESGPWVTPNITTDGAVQVGYFTFFNMPATIEGKTVSTVNINYNPTAAGNHAVYVKFTTDGGNGLLDVLGIAGTNPAALIEFQTPDGSGWVTYQSGVPFSFGNVTENQTRNLKMRITNNGTGSAVPLSLTVSKPPYGVSGLIGAVNNVDLAEGTLLQANQSQTATLYCSVPRSQVNMADYNGTAVWTLNTGDPKMGKQTIQFTCNAVSEQIGPLLGNGVAQYKYTGCFRENNPGRQLSTNPLSGNDMTNEKCINKCSSLGYRFAGTQYLTQCWCGKALPLLKDNENDCNYNCAGNENQTCGGNGYFHNQSQISLFADSTRFDGNVTTQTLQIVPSYKNYNYAGCWAESGGKTLTAATTSSDSMTIEMCGDFCIAKGASFFGVSYAAECYCGSKIAATSKLTLDSKCSMTCKGSNSQYCGAGNLITLYSNTTNSVSSSSSIISSTTSLVSSSSVSSSLISSDSSSSISSSTISSASSSGATSSGLTSVSSSSSVTSSGVASTSSLSVSGSDVSSSSSTIVSSPTSSVLSSSISSIVSTTSTSTSASATPTGPVAKQTVGSYVYQGCYTEIGGRALNVKSFSNSSNSLEFCATFCTGFTFFATEYASECYCGNTLAPASVPATDGRCNMICSADKYEFCGGPNGLSLYKLGPVVVSSSSASSSIQSSSISSSSVISTSSASVILSSSSASSSSALSASSVSAGSSLSSSSSISSSSVATSSLSSSSTISSSISSDASSSTTSAVSTSSTSNTISSSSSSAAPSSSSSVLSSLTSSISSSIASDTPSSSSTVASSSSSSILSSLSSSTSSVVSSSSTTSDVSSSSSSIVSSSSGSVVSSSTSSTASSSSSGTTSSLSLSSSVVSSSISSDASSSSSGTISSSSVSVVPSTSSSIVSSGSTSESATVSSSSASSTSASSTSASSTSASSTSASSTSAGSTSASSTSSSAISSSSSVASATTSYSSSSSSVASSSLTSVISSSSTAASSTSSSATPTGPRVIPTVSSYVAQGCYSEATSGRSLAATSFTNSTGMTPAMCAAFCTKYAMFGVEYGVECYCGPYLRPGSVNVTDSACNMPCPGDKLALCGAGNRLNVYYSNDTSKASTDPRNLDTVGNYKFYNCVKDSPRVLNTVSSNNNMTVDNCQKLAEAGGYQFFGVEYARECYLGNTMTSGTQNATMTDCNMACAGNPGQLCGGGTRLSLYKRST
ncbi:WSC-domain-containing protein [Aureobasidium pullulans]|nr:WSC-domain-containing protein [Aureobasidium pullulans]